jgi:predicted branched-subunit amino acid permease
LVIGVSAAHAEIPTLAGWLTAPLIFSGSAQVATIELLDGGAAPLVVVAAAVVINLRLILYSATMAPHWQGTPRWWRALAAYLMVDPSVAVGVDGYRHRHAADRGRGHLHYLGAAALLWVVWLAAIGVGATAGTRLPAALRLDFVIPLFLAGNVAARLDDRATCWAVAVAVVLAVGTVSAPLHAGVMLAIAGGVAAGLHTRGSDR